jgi:hypothetical protein
MPAPPKPYLPALLGLILLVSLANPSSAAVLICESFDYTPGLPVAGLDGGSGWGDVWQTVTNAAATATIVSGLTLGDYPVAGSALQMSQGTTTDTAALGFAGRAFGNTVDNKNPFYLSYLVRQTRDEGVPFGSGQNTQFGHDFSEVGIGTVADNDRVVQARLSGSNDFGGPEGINVSIDKQSSGGTAAFTFPQDETFLVVLAYETLGFGSSEAGSTTATLWLLDADDYDAVVAAGISKSVLNTNNRITVTESDVFDKFGPKALESADVLRFYTAEADVTFDEILGGTELTDVIAIPEPATATLIAVGLGLIAVRRRHA